MHKAAFVLALLTLAVASQAQTVFYGGDFDGRNALVSSRGTNSGYSYDDFSLNTLTNVSSLFGNFLLNGGAAGFTLTADYEIRSGMTAGNGGTLISSGTGLTATRIATGRTGFGLTEYQYTISGLNLNLSAGTYFMALRPVAVTGGGGTAYVSTTSGADVSTTGDPNPAPTGAPLANGNSYFDSATYGASFDPATSSNALGAGTWDFSYGVAAVPEPTTIAALGFGAAALLRRRKRA